MNEINGNIGITTKTPSAKLDIQTTSASDTMFKVVNATGTNIFNISSSGQINSTSSINLTGSVNISGSSTIHGEIGTTTFYTNADLIKFTGSMSVRGDLSTTGQISFGFIDGGIY